MRTIGHEFLDIESKYFSVPKKSYDNLDKLIELADKRIKIFDLPEEKLKKINFLIWREGFQTKDNQLLSTALFTKDIDCKHYSILFYSIAEALHLPIDVIKYPEHVGLAWNDINSNFLWEPTSCKKLKKEDYIRMFNISKESIGNYFIKKMNRNALFSICYDVIGLEFYQDEKMDEALDLFDKALIFDPDSYETLINRATVKSEEGNPEGAVEDYSRALNIHKCPQIHLCLGYNYVFLGKEGLAERHYNEAIKNNKKMANAYICRAYLNIARKNFSKALRDCNKAIQIDSKEPMAYTHRSEIHYLMGNERKSKEDEIRYLLASKASQE
ncbi:hypothetical protein KY334_05695 [Candidatus Woesearchaeota archaeon]|nr:hypothetical protein [Candidatus Woesearchaeota archaeon]